MYFITRTATTAGVLVWPETSVSMETPEIH